MQPERWQQIEQLFHLALEQKPDQRAGFLEHACSGDELLRSEVEDLISSHEQAQDFIETPASDLAAELLANDHTGLVVGQSVGRYEIVSVLGVGGMGEVYLAKDPRLGRHVALKLLPQRFTINAERVGRFEQEARAVSALNHPSIVTIHEIGRAHNAQFIVTEFVEGQTLRQYMAETAISLRLALEVSIQVTSALEAAHAAGIVHRDIKPENIMLRTDGYVKVLDFGVARLLAPQGGSSDPDSAVTAAGTAVGTLRYMSPEQACAEPITSATDVFSLGMVLFELATGQHPFAATSDVAIVRALLTAPTPNPSRLNPAVPPVLDTLIARMLEKEASRRPAASEVESVLLELARGRLTHEPPHTAATPDRRTVGRDRDRRELRRAFEEAAGGRGVLISVAGEPGIGKTTIVEEFLSELSAGSRSTRIARGQCSERLAGTEAYLPLLEALDSLMASPARESG